MNRRNFLIRSAAVAGGAILPATTGSLLAASPNLQFPTEPRLRLAVASYPFRAFISLTPGGEPAKGKMDLKAFGAMVASRYSLSNIEPLGEHFASTEDAYLRDLRNSLDKLRVRVVNIPASVGASLYDADAAKRKTAVENGRRWINAAAALGSPGVRLHIQGPRSVKPNVDRTAESLRQVVEYSEGKGIVVTLENDDLFTEDAFFLVEVIEKVHSPWLRGLPDFCNSMLGGDEAFNYRAVEAMFKHAYNIAHVKDMEVDGPKTFRVDVNKTFAIAKAQGYRGYFSMEFEGAGDPYEGTRKLIEASLKCLA